MRPHLQSLRNRLAAGVLVATVLALWVVTFTISHYLRRDMEAAISAQQFSTVSLIGAELDRSVEERMAVLTNSARRLGASGPLAGPRTQAFLDEQAGLRALFNWGILVTDAQGVAIASVPQALDRVGTSYADRPFMAELLATGTPRVTEPALGKRTGAPVVSMAVPIRSEGGAVQGAILGIINLERPNFLDEISTSKYGLTGDFLLTTPGTRTFIASSDKRRLMKAGPPRGTNPVFDRYLEGYEGSGVAVSSHGVEELSSSRRLASTGWLMQSVLPTEEAFAPIRAMQRQLGIISVLLTLLAGGIAWWWVRHQLQPLEEASGLLDRMRDGTLPRQPLPVRHADELGQLANAFNGLLAVIDEQEALAAENAANRRVRKILSHVPGMVFQYRLLADGSGAFPFASEAVRAIYEVSPAEVELDASKIRSMLVPEDSERFFLSLNLSAQSMQPWKLDYRIVTQAGALKWLRIDAVPEAGSDGLITWYGFVTDITATRVMESELRVAAATFESQEGIFVTDARGVILRVNRAFSKITGYTDAEAAGRTPSFLKSGRHDREFYRQLWAALLGEGYWVGEIWNRRKGGEVYPEWVTISAVRDPEGRTSHYVAAFTDITEHKKSQQRIHDLAFFDPLTNLPNRRLLLDRVRQALAASERSRQLGAVIFVDLDHFKVLNDTKGHDVGDELLKQTAVRLSAAVRSGDTVARLGGDEFVVLLTNLGDEPREAAIAAELVAEKLRLAISRPYDLAGYPYLLSSSSGITLFVDREPGVDVLLKQADLALYQAKAAGRNTIRFFDPAMQLELDDRAAIEAGLREALRSGGLQLHYQPQVDLAGRLIGAEALLRWWGPTGEPIPPADFIPLAEETGLIVPLGAWVLETACARLEAWAADARLASLVLSVNVSARQFGQPGFVGEVEEAVQRHRVGPGRLQLELTESVVLGNVAEAIARMQALRRLGVSFSLDDFGTGYSSLSYLKRLPFDQLKIDQEFVRDVVADPDNAAIVKAIIGLGATLDLAVIAEGVETPAQHDFLRGLACGAYQGYLFGHPMPVAEFERLAQGREVLSAAG
jgi:diguanylate cyclase (GGDEF)-like protein/PAS domain S-box-containing protein